MSRKTRKRRGPDEVQRRTILWVDDDIYFISDIVGHVRDLGYDVIVANGPDEALSVFAQRRNEISLVVVDMMMPPGESLPHLETKGGYATGLALARRILRERPGLPVLAFSVVADAPTMEWFNTHAKGYLVKPALTEDIVRAIRRAIGDLNDGDAKPGPRSFLVHGHDGAVLLELKNYLQNTLGLPEPVILREQPSLGRTIIEKFEGASDAVDLVFVLLTPDDVAVSKGGASTRRARQNVIFELGFFFAKLQRRSGRVLLLHKGPLEIPSDISGIVYLDISQGIENAGEAIRRELKPWLQ